MPSNMTVRHAGLRVCPGHAGQGQIRLAAADGRDPSSGKILVVKLWGCSRQVPEWLELHCLQVTVADVDGDGLLEVVAADTLGTLAVFTAQGHEVWERHVKSGLSQVRSWVKGWTCCRLQLQCMAEQAVRCVQGASFGDVNSDGELEIVFATNTGAVYMVAGATGEAGLPCMPCLLRTFTSK